MSRCLVSISFGDQVADLDLPAQVPAVNLAWLLTSGLDWRFPDFIELYLPEKNRLLGEGETLDQAGVLDGEFVLLREAPRSSRQLINPVRGWDAMTLPAATGSSGGPPADDGFAWKEV